MVHDANDIKQAVRERYARTVTEAAGNAATSGGSTQSAAASCCGSAQTPTPRAAGSCCGSATVAPAPRAEAETSASGGGTATDNARLDLGYSSEDLAAVPEGADLGLGCGNPLGMLELCEGETVLDLGSGAGIDAFIAAKRVGRAGRVIGVDMTPEMILQARRNAETVAAENVEFRLGEIEHLPVADETVDAIISNCVINLVPDKPAVFADAFRVLRPGGRLSVSDIVLLGELPAQVRDSVAAYVACLGGASLKTDYLGMLQDAGFTDVRVTDERSFSADDVASADVVEEFKQHAEIDDAELSRVAATFQSIRVSARKPA